LRVKGDGREEKGEGRICIHFMSEMFEEFEIFEVFTLRFSTFFKGDVRLRRTEGY